MISFSGVIATSTTTMPAGPLNVLLEAVTVPQGATLPSFAMTELEWIGVQTGRPHLTIEGDRLPPGWQSGQERPATTMPILRPGWTVTFRNGGDEPLVLWRLTVAPPVNPQTT
jgi:hypothetical protein